MIASFKLGLDVEGREPVLLPATGRTRGLYVIGNSGMGKTTLLESLILQDVEQGNGVCLLDPHGDLVESVLSRLPACRVDDVVLLDVLDVEHPFGLNLFACPDPADPIHLSRTVAGAVQAFKKVWGPGTRESSWGPQMEDLLRTCAVTLATTPGMTLVELPRLLTEAAFRARLVARLPEGAVRASWTEEYDLLRPQDQIERRASTMNKVRAFLANPIARSIVGQSQSSVDVRHAMDENKIILVKLAAEYEDLTNLLGTVMVGQVLTAALSRVDLPEAQRRLFMLYADEYQRFASPDFKTLLSEARKYKVSTSLAHQYRGQLDDDNREATLAIRNLVVFAVSGPDAQELALQFDTTPKRGRAVGQRPVLTVAQDVVGHLLRDGQHGDIDVREFVREFLSPIHAWYLRLAPESHVERPIDGMAHYRIGYYDARRSSLLAGLQLINEYFVDVMERRYDAVAPMAVPLVLQIVDTLRAYLALAEESHFTRRTVYGLYDQRDEVDEQVIPLPASVTETIRGYINADFEGGRLLKAATETIMADIENYDGSQFPLVKDTMLAARARRRSAFDALVNARVDSLGELLVPFFREVYLGTTTRSLREGMAAKVQGAVLQRAKAECERLKHFVDELSGCAQMLAAQPIIAPSGAYEPMYEEQTHQERANEIANHLSTLPAHTARCRLEIEGRVVEYTLRPLYSSAVSDDRAADRRRMRVRERSRVRYASPRDVVEAIIANRQGPAPVAAPVVSVQPEAAQTPRTRRMAPIAPRA